MPSKNKKTALGSYHTGLDTEAQKYLLLAIENSNNNFQTKDLFTLHPSVFGECTQKKFKQVDDKRRWFLSEKQDNPERYWKLYSDIIAPGDGSFEIPRDKSDEDDDDDDDDTSTSSVEQDRTRASPAKASATKASASKKFRSPSSARKAAAAKKKASLTPTPQKKASPTPTPRTSAETMEDIKVIEVSFDRPETNFPFVITRFRDEVIDRTAIDGFTITRKNVFPRDVHDDLYSLKRLSDNELLYIGPFVDGSGISRKDAKSRVEAKKKSNSYSEKMDLEQQILVGCLNRDKERNIHKLIIRFDKKTFLSNEYFMLPGENTSDEYAIFTDRYPVEYNWVKEGTEDQDEPEMETVEATMTDLYWHVAISDPEDREIDEKPEKKLPKHMRGLGARMKGMNIG